MIGFYNILISFFNILTLIFGVLIVFPITINQPDLLTMSNMHCAAITYFSRVFVQMSCWLHVLLSLDRYLCVAFNEKFQFLLTDKKKLSFIIACLMKDEQAMFMRRIIKHRLLYYSSHKHAKLIF